MSHDRSPDVAPAAADPGLPDLRADVLATAPDTLRTALARRLPLLVAAKDWALSPHPDHELERLRERLVLRDERRYLEQARAGRDVCWPQGADSPDPLVTVRIATYNRG